MVYKVLTLENQTLGFEIPLDWTESGKTPTDLVPGLQPILRLVLRQANEGVKHDAVDQDLGPHRL